MLITFLLALLVFSILAFRGLGFLAWVAMVRWGAGRRAWW